MDDGTRNEMSLKTATNLSSYLIEKAKNHKNFKYYSSKNRIEGILENHTVYLSTGSRWNDTTDSENFNNDQLEYKNFGLCLSFSRSESVAMWMLYSRNLGCMIDYSSDVIRSILKTKTVKLGFFENDVFNETEVLSDDKFRVSISDVIYYGKSKKGGEDTYYVRRSGESYDQCRKDAVDSLSFYKKTLPWYYENECRIVVSISRKLLRNSKCDTVAIEFPEEYLDKLRERVYDSPNNKKGIYKPSALKNSIDWNLCKDCNKEIR